MSRPGRDGGVRIDDVRVDPRVHSHARAVHALAREENVADELSLANLEVRDGLGGELALSDGARAGMVETERGPVARGERRAMGPSDARVIRPGRRERGGAAAVGFVVAEGREAARGGGGGERVDEDGRGGVGGVGFVVLGDLEERVEERPTRAKAGLLRETTMEIGELDARGAAGRDAIQAAPDGVRGGVLVWFYGRGQRAAHQSHGQAEELVHGGVGEVPGAILLERRANETTNERRGVGIRRGDRRGAPVHGHRAEGVLKRRRSRARRSSTRRDARGRRMCAHREIPKS